MPITLAQAKVSMREPYEQVVYDEFRRGSFLLDALTFDNAVAPGTGGSTLVYGYQRLETPSTAGFRAINNEYAPNHALRKEYVSYLKIFGGSFEIDRVIQDTTGQVNELNFQLQQKIQGAINLFHNTVINGDSAVNALAFDGLDKALTGTVTEFNKNSVLDLSTGSALDSQRYTLLELMDEFKSELMGKPTMFLGNSKLINKIKAVARRAGYLTETEDAFGRTVQAYDGIPLIDLEYFFDGTNSNPIVPIVNRTVGTAQTGLTDLYAVSLGLDGFHAISPTGNSIVKTFLPDFTQPGAVKKGEVEMVAGIALKQSRKAGVLRNIKVI